MTYCKVTRQMSALPNIFMGPPARHWAQLRHSCLCLDWATQIWISGHMHINCLSITRYRPMGFNEMHTSVQALSLRRQTSLILVNTITCTSNFNCISSVHIVVQIQVNRYCTTSVCILVQIQVNQCFRCMTSFYNMSLILFKKSKLEFRILTQLQRARHLNGTTERENGNFIVTW